MKIIKLKSIGMYLIIGSPTTTAPPFNPCDISFCDFGVCVNENGTATCVCNQACPFIEQPVCGSDNKTYANLCVMDSEACERKERITVQNDGPCGMWNNFCVIRKTKLYTTHPAQHSTAQHSTAQRSAAQHSTPSIKDKVC